jgi:hypothetical protein
MPESPTFRGTRHLWFPKHLLRYIPLLVEVDGWEVVLGLVFFFFGYFFGGRVQ